ncbi:MAG: hypothetical protein R6U98_31270 [Pirellulaceae bacterium]
MLKLVLFVPVLIAVAMPARAEICLVERGEARGVVVTADASTKTATYAAEELVRHVREATGVTMEVVKESQVPTDVHTCVYVGETKAAGRNGVEPAAEEVEQYWDYWENYANENMMRFLKLFRDVGFRYRAYPLCAHEAFPPACFEPAREKLAEALEAARRASSPEYAERVRFLKIGLDHAQLTADLAAAFDGHRDVPEQQLTEARQALDQLVQFRKKHQHTFFSDLLWVTSYWERPRWNLTPLVE